MLRGRLSCKSQRLEYKRGSSPWSAPPALDSTMGSLTIYFAQQLCCLLNYRSFSVTSPHSLKPHFFHALRRLPLSPAPDNQGALADRLGRWSGATLEHPLWSADSAPPRIWKREFSVRERQGKENFPAKLHSTYVWRLALGKVEWWKGNASEILPRFKACPSSQTESGKAEKQTPGARRGKRYCASEGSTGNPAKKGGHFTPRLIKEAWALLSKPLFRSIAA